MTYTDLLAWGGGTQTALAKRLGIDQSTVSCWSGQVPCHIQTRVQLMTGGQLMADPECIDPRIKGDE